MNSFCFLAFFFLFLFPFFLFFLFLLFLLFFPGFQRKKFSFKVIKRKILGERAFDFHSSDIGSLGTFLGGKKFDVLAEAKSLGIVWEITVGQFRPPNDSTASSHGNLYSLFVDKVLFWNRNEAGGSSTSSMKVCVLGGSCPIFEHVMKPWDTTKSSIVFPSICKVDQTLKLHVTGVIGSIVFRWEIRKLVTFSFVSSQCPNPFGLELASDICTRIEIPVSPSFKRSPVVLILHRKISCSFDRHSLVLLWQLSNRNVNCWTKNSITVNAHPKILSFQQFGKHFVQASI